MVIFYPLLFFRLSNYTFKMEISLSNSGLPYKYGKITLRMMRRDDVDEMAAWPYHLDPFYSKGIRLPGSKLGRDKWWRDHQREPFSILLGAQNSKGRLVGRVSVTVVDEKNKEGVMGIRIRPELENLGYGADLLKSFLAYWFIFKDMKILCFDANVLNKRAAACYKKARIPIVGYHYDYHPTFLHEKQMHKSGFLKYIDYRITKEQYLEIKKSDDSAAKHPV